MSSQRKDTLKNLLKKSMFASTAALMLASTSSLAAALVNRNVIADNAVLSSGANLDQNGGNVSFNRLCSEGYLLWFFWTKLSYFYGSTFTE